jgi:FtsZ-binding cell division protein ZapB
MSTTSGLEREAKAYARGRMDAQRAAAEKIEELERENAALQKERDYAVKWGNAAVESVQEAMWRYQDALRAVFARLDHPGNADQRVQYFLRWPEVKAARAALAGSGEK